MMYIFCFGPQQRLYDTFEVYVALGNMYGIHVPHVNVLSRETIFDISSTTP